MSTETRYVTPAEMSTLARKAREEAGIIAAEAARRLDVSQPSVHRAENDSSGRYVKLQARMIRELSGWPCEGPLWRVEMKSEA